MQFKIQTLVNSYFNSNTYLLTSSKNNNDCYLIDAGNFADVMNQLENNEKIKAIFLTHAHYDHISSINEITTRFPKCIVYCSQYTKEALADSKINLSFYLQKPTVFVSDTIRVVTEQDTIELFANHFLEIWETPGHNKGCLSFKINQAIFTGDTLIPNIAVVTKLKSGNKKEAQKSILKIQNSTKINDVIYPGHGASIEVSKINWKFYY
ncbi:MAG: MBL fold metallo-hydrolase [Flavobacteriaceae bacterium]|nr:MBL fold metallo-hydrolase [Flavobacteriaceae bacterium]